MGQKVFLREENPMGQKREGKEKAPNPAQSLEEIKRAKRLSIQPSSKHRRILTAEKSLIFLWRVVDLQDA